MRSFLIEKKKQRVEIGGRSRGETGGGRVDCAGKKADKGMLRGQSEERGRGPEMEGLW